MRELITRLRAQICDGLFNQPLIISVAALATCSKPNPNKQKQLGRNKKEKRQQQQAAEGITRGHWAIGKEENDVGAGVIFQGDG